MNAKNEKNAEKQKKTVYLKQYMVTEDLSGVKKRSACKIAYILQTCSQTARKEFEDRFGAKVGSCMLAADSDFRKEDLANHDFWKELRNWETTARLPTENRKYSEIKKQADLVSELKKQAGIADWDKATEKQKSAFRRLLSQSETTQSDAV